MMTDENPLLRQKVKVKRRLQPKRTVFERLSRKVVPSKYEIYIEPDYPRCDTFKGIAAITIKITEPTKIIVVNGVGLEPLEATFDYRRKVHRCFDCEVDDENELITIEFEEDLPAREGTLSILYVGTISTSTKGFFHTNYTKSLAPGQGRMSFGTQFEPVMARCAFPCFDEPNFKATFDLSIVTPVNRTALSNMTIVKEMPFSDSGNYKILTFGTTPVMPTYLVGFAIGDWDTLEGTSKDGIPVKAYLPLGKKSQGEFGFQLAINFLNYFSDYFNIPFPLPKLDLVTFPNFRTGSMENWGLIAFSENAFLVDPVQSSSMTKQWVATLTAIKVAQQWFGNLVTVNWWTDLWLKEGFPAFLALGAVDQVCPEFRLSAQFTSIDMINVMELDALTHSHPINVPITDPEEIGMTFDTISLYKGAALMSMLEKYTGTDPFRRAVRTFLGAYSYKTVEPLQVWETFEVATGLPVIKVMKTWTDQMGFPLVKIADLEQTREGRSITLTQEKFTADPKFGCDKVELSDYLWVFPVSFTKASSPQAPIHTVLMDGTEAAILDFVIPGVGPKEWVKVNGCLSGYYRVHYPRVMMRDYMCSIRSRTMAPFDRLNLLDDLYALARCGEVHTVDVLRLLEVYVNEDDFVVWEGISRTIGGLKEMLEYTDFSNAFYTFARNLLRTFKTRFGWDSLPEEEAWQRMFRSSVLVRLISLEDEETVEEGSKRFLGHMETMPLSSDLRSPAYRAVLAVGQSEAVEALLMIYRDSKTSAEEKHRVLRALGSPTKPELIDRVLALTEDIQAEEIVPIFLNMAANKNGREKAWEFLKGNIGLFQKKFTAGVMLSSFLKHLLRGFCSEEKLTEVQTFFEANPLFRVQSTVDQILESIRTNAEWRRRDTNGIEAFLTAPPAEVVTID